MPKRKPRAVQQRLETHDDDRFVSGVRTKADVAADESQPKRRRDEQRNSLRDSVDRYLDDLDSTLRVTPAEEVTQSERLMVACAECLALAREAGIAIDVGGDDLERHAIIVAAARLWRLLDEHAEASGDPRRRAMVRIVEEELGQSGEVLAGLRVRMNKARVRALRARETLTQANLALVVYVAKNYRNRGVPMADLIQEGNISLMRAVEKFDPDRGARLSTYATTWLHNSMRRTVRSQSRTVRIPESAKNARSQSVPIDEPMGQDRLSLTDVLCADDAIAPDDMAEREEIRARAREFLTRLSDQEALIVRRRFGIEHPQSETLREIGEFLGITRERVRQIEKCALDKLRKRMRASLG